MANIRLRNLRPALLDLSSVADVNGKKHTLRPAGTTGDSAEYDEKVKANVNIATFMRVGWVKAESLAVEAPAAPVPPKKEGAPETKGPAAPSKIVSIKMNDSAQAADDAKTPSTSPSTKK